MSVSLDLICASNSGFEQGHTPVKVVKSLSYPVRPWFLATRCISSQSALLHADFKTSARFFKLSETIVAKLSQQHASLINISTIHNPPLTS